MNDKPKKSLIDELKQLLPWLAKILIVAYLFSLFAEYFYILDLFSHFKIQYAIGGIVMFPLMVYFRQYYHAPFVLIIGLLSIWDITRAYDPMLQIRTSSERIITVAQYNKLNINNNYEKIGTWLKNNAANIDIIFVQESLPETIADLQQFKDKYPHQFPGNKSERYNDISILSKHPLTINYVPLAGYDYKLNATKVTLHIDGFDRPVRLYSLHTTIPMDYNQQRERNAQLANFAKAIAADDNPYIIASGDWNITPYSPFFQEFKKVSGLKQPIQGWFPDTTWPSFFIAPFLKIPIDHILHSDNLQLIEQHVGPAMGSDHHSLIASFAISD
jgi:endonuclease/exonuclease/phosphatase (EEP) superfamily protein YafD